MHLPHMNMIFKKSIIVSKHTLVPYPVVFLLVLEVTTLLLQVFNFNL